MNTCTSHTQDTQGFPAEVEEGKREKCEETMSVSFVLNVLKCGRSLTSTSSFHIQ